jgi:hypothetical protein
MSKRKAGRGGKNAPKPDGAGSSQLRLVSSPAPDAAGESDSSVSGGELVGEQLAAELAESAGQLLETSDPLEVEVLASMLLGAVPIPTSQFEPILASEIIPALATVRRPEIVMLLLGLGAVADDPAGEVARDAANELITAGVEQPAWAGELAEPVTVGDCVELSDPEGLGSVLACAFHRGGRAHGMLVTVDHQDCGAAGQASLLDGNDIEAALTEITEQSEGVELGMQRLDPALFRWKLEAAMAARAHHDLDDDTDLDIADLGNDDVLDEEFFDEEFFDEDAFGEDGEPGYPVLEPLLRARMRALPEPPWPQPTHPGTSDEGEGESLFGLFSQMLSASLASDPALQPAAELPPARDAAHHGPAPVYRLKISLRRAKPPIWRRLELPGDARLDELHGLIQAAFGWDEAHLHAFETPYGDFGPPEADVPELAGEQTVTLEQVAPAEASSITYRYDFGDNWEHQIQVEAILNPDPEVAYPRCTGGRRAAPPEDCGGIIGYRSLLAALADPADPEHAEARDWLGLDTTDEFDPAAFNARDVTDRLPQLSRR